MKIGTSNRKHIGPILEILQKAEQVTDGTFRVLDVGCGKGVYGYLLRGMFGRSKLELIGVEPYKPRKLNEAMLSAYDRIYRQDIQKFLETKNEHFAVILANHVMEHLRKEEAISCIKKFKLLADLVLIGLPKARAGHVYPNANGTDYHTHKWGCTDRDFRDLGLHHAKTIKDNMLFWWANEDMEKHFLYLN